MSVEWESKYDNTWLSAQRYDSIQIDKIDSRKLLLVTHPDQTLEQQQQKCNNIAVEREMEGKQTCFVKEDSATSSYPKMHNGSTLTKKCLIKSEFT